MTRSHLPADGDYDFVLPAFSYRKRLAIIWVIAAGVGLVLLLVTWTAFFKYVPPGKHLVIISKNGAPLDEGEVLAKEGQKGIQKEVKGEGWHLIMPIIYATDVEDNTIIPPGQVGIVTARGGKPLPSGRFLADEGEQGIQRQVLPPGAYRLNKHGFDVEVVDATEIKPGYVGVLRRKLGKDGKGRFAANDSDEKGIIRKVLQPGLYYINTKEFDVIKAEVGIIQTTFNKAKNGGKDTAITFTSNGGFPISIDCTVEWEVLPEHMPDLLAEYGAWQQVEQKVIDMQAHAIGRDKGIDYTAQEFLEGKTREKFQEDFTEELTRVCKEKNVTIHSAFIRRIDIPEEYLQPIRDKQIAAETQLTNKAKEITAQTEIEVKREKQMIEQEVAKVTAETKREVAGIEQEVKNITVKTDAEVEKLKAEYAAKIAALDSERKRVVGEADAEVKKMKDTAKSNLYQLKMEVFQSDANAYLRYTLAEQLNPNMVLRFFHSGPGTLWTNMDNKGMNFMLPVPADGSSPKVTTNGGTKESSNGHGDKVTPAGPGK